MATFGGPNTIETGLVLALDAANRQSYVSGSTTWNDLSGNRNSGSLVSGPTFSTEAGGSIVFDGSDDYVNLTDSSILNSTLNGDTNWTVTYWVNPITNGRILDRGNIGDDPTGALELNVGSISRNNTSGGSSSLTGNIIGSGWSHVSLVRNSTLLHSWYLNGNFSNSTQTTENYGGSGIWKIGRRALTLSSILEGKLSTILIYNRALSASEIQQNYNAMRGRFGI